MVKKTLNPKDTRKLLPKAKYTKIRRVHDKLMNTDDTDIELVMDNYLEYLKQIDDPEYNKDIRNFGDFSFKHEDIIEREKYIAQNITPKYLKGLCTLGKHLFCEKLPQSDMNDVTAYLLTQFVDETEGIDESQGFDYFKKP